MDCEEKPQVPEEFQEISSEEPQQAVCEESEDSEDSEETQEEIE